MSDIAPLGRPDPTGPLSYDASARSRRVNDATPAGVSRGTDRVDVSSQARLATMIDRVKDLPIRSEFVDAARALIADGTYDTEDRVDQAIDKLLADFA